MDVVSQTTRRKNALLGLVLMGFCGFVYWWSIKAVTTSPDSFTPEEMRAIELEMKNEFKEQEDVNNLKRL
jgi:hypothetical protein